MQPPGHERSGREAEIASRLRARDPDVVDEVFHFHGRRLNGIARRMVGSDGTADDVVQETFMLLWEHPDRFDPERGTLSAYLSATSRSRALDLLRREAARRGREDRVAADARERTYTHVEDEGIRGSLRERLDRALAELPARQREAIALAYFGHLTYEEVAAALGRPIGTVKSRIRTGLRTLYEAIEPDWSETTGTDG
jgi:RNA polymerase sigma-70 factor (ECF subfamily)